MGKECFCIFAVSVLSNRLDKNNVILSNRLDEMGYKTLFEMDKLALEKIMVDNQAEVERHEVFKRNYQFEDFGNYVLVGIRRAGKSYILYQQMQKRLAEGHGWDTMLYLNFEDERLGEFTAADFNLILEAHLELYGKRPVLFLDEVQNIDGWEKFARRLADSKYKVFITGSNAKMLSADMQSSLGGRYIAVQVYPYSFTEFLDVNGTHYDRVATLRTEGRALIMNRFNDYLYNGGFPEGALLKAKRDYLTSVYQKIYLGDIAARNNVSNVFGLKVMIKKIAESVKQPLSYNRVANIISSAGSKISTTTTVKYMEFLEQAWLVSKVTNIAAKLADKESNAKYYFTDNGILDLFLIDEDTTLLENLVAVELLRRFGREESVFFYNKNIEVDFYVPEAQLAVQVSFSLKDAETRQRELRGLVQLSKVLPCKKLLIITYDEAECVDVGGVMVEVIPAWRWLTSRY